MTQPFGIDTSVLVRLVTATPDPDFQRCVNELRILIGGARRRGVRLEPGDR